MSARPSPSPTNVPAIADSDRVAPTFGRERADERAPAQADGAQHAELRLPFVGEHEEDVDEQQDSGEHRERAERRVEPRQRLPAAFGAIEHGLLAIVRRSRRRRRAAPRARSSTARGALRAGFDATGVRHEHDRLRRRRGRRPCSGRRHPGDRARARRRCCSTRSRHPTSSPRRPAWAGPARRCRRNGDAVRERVDRVAGLQLQRAREIASDDRLARRPAWARRCRSRAASPPNARAAAKSVSSSCAFGAARTGAVRRARPTRVVVVSASVPSTFGSCRPASRDVEHRRRGRGRSPRRSRRPGRAVRRPCAGSTR